MALGMLHVMYLVHTCILDHMQHQTCVSLRASFVRNVATDFFPVGIIQMVLYAHYIITRAASDLTSTVSAKATLLFIWL